VYNINSESVSHFSKFISVRVKKNLRKSQAQFREKLRKLRLRQYDGILIKKRASPQILSTALFATAEKNATMIFHWLPNNNDEFSLQNFKIIYVHTYITINQYWCKI